MEATGIRSRWALTVPWVLAVSIAVSGCRTATILKGTFEGDSVGAAPAATLDREPTGDNYSYSGGGSAPIVLRDNQFSPTALSSWARFENVAAGTDQTMTFLSKTYEASRFPTIWGYWTGEVVREATGAAMTASFQDAGGTEACRITLAGGNYSFNGGSALANGYVVDQPHTIIFAANNTAQTCELTIFQRNGNQSALSAPYATTLTGNRRQLVFTYSNAGASAQYGIDAVLITREAPEMM